jgi:hypothetical protein
MDTTLENDSAWRIVLRPLITPRGWTAVTHHLLGLPLGTAYFIWLVTGLSLGLGLAITLLGIPILTAVLAGVRPLQALERGLANALLGTSIASTGFAPHGEGFLGRLKAYWTDSTTWRGLAYLFTRFPVGILTFTVAVTVYSIALTAIAAPLLAPLEAMDLGFWEPDTVLEGLAFVPFGFVALIAAGWISEGMAAMSSALARWGTR